MKKNASDYVIALTVVVCSLMLLGALTFALSGFTWHRPKRTLEIDFANVGGIQPHSEVRYAGAPAGRVKAMHALTPEERQHLPAGHESAAVRITVVVNDDVPAFGNDATVTLSSDTLLSEEYVAIVPGRADAAPLDETAVLLAKPGSSINSLLDSMGPLFENANQTMAELKTQLAAVVPKLGVVLDSTKQTSDSAQALVVSADRLIKDNSQDIHQRLEELGKVMSSLQTVLSSTNATVAHGDQLINNGDQLIGHLDDQLGARMRELGVVLQNLKVISTYAKSLTETLATRPNALIFGSKTKTALPSEAEILRSAKPVPTNPANLPEKPRR